MLRPLQAADTAPPSPAPPGLTGDEIA